MAFTVSPSSINVTELSENGFLVLASALHFVSGSKGDNIKLGAHANLKGRAFNNYAGTMGINGSRQTRTYKKRYCSTCVKLETSHCLPHHLNYVPCSLYVL